MTTTNGVDDSRQMLRIGVVGFGYWGPNLCRVISENNDCELSWVCELDDRKRRAVEHRFPAARPTSSFDDLLNDSALDAVFLATPIASHFHLASQALQAGKHTFVEKPLAPSVLEADALFRHAADRTLSLMCGHTFIYSPPVSAVRDLITSGELGDIYFVSSSRVNLGLHQSDVGVIWDLGPHDFSILRHWLGERPSQVSAIGRDSIIRGVTDVAFVTLQFPSGILANAEMSWLSPSKLRRTVVVGSRKMVVYEDGAPEPIKIFDSGVVYEDPESFGEYHLSYRTGDILSPRVPTVEPLAAQLTDFVVSARRGRAPEGHSDLCRDVVAILEAAEESLRQEGSSIELSAADQGSDRPSHA